MHKSFKFVSDDTMKKKQNGTNRGQLGVKGIAIEKAKGVIHTLKIYKNFLLLRCGWRMMYKQQKKQEYNLKTV